MVSILGRAAIAIERLNLQEKSDLADELFTQQPQLLASVLVQHKLGTSFAQLDVHDQHAVDVFSGHEGLWAGLASHF